MDNSPFAKLSPELRDMIYDFALPDPLDVSRRMRRKSNAKHVLNLTQLCRQIREEAPPYKLCIANQEEDPINWSHVAVLSAMVYPFERAAEAFQRLPVWLRSRRTTIELHVMLRTGRCTADGLRTSYERSGADWDRIRRALQVFNQAHNLILTFGCKYVVVPYAARARFTGLECITFLDSARALDIFHMRVTAGSHGLSEAVARHREAMKRHDRDDPECCSIKMEHDLILHALGEAVEMTDVFLQFLFLDQGRC
jgi:hypothetical protein